MEQLELFDDPLPRKDMHGLQIVLDRMQKYPEEFSGTMWDDKTSKWHWLVRILSDTDKELPFGLTKQEESRLREEFKTIQRMSFTRRVLQSLAIDRDSE